MGLVVGSVAKAGIPTLGGPTLSQSPNGNFTGTFTGNAAGLTNFTGNTIAGNQGVVRLLHPDGSFTNFFGLDTNSFGNAVVNACNLATNNDTVLIGAGTAWIGSNVLFIVQTNYAVKILGAGPQWTSIQSTNGVVGVFCAQSGMEIGQMTLYGERGIWNYDNPVTNLYCHDLVIWSTLAQTGITSPESYDLIVTENSPNCTFINLTGYTDYDGFNLGGPNCYAQNITCYNTNSILALQGNTFHDIGDYLGTHTGNTLTINGFNCFNVTSNGVSTTKIRALELDGASAILQHGYIYITNGSALNYLYTYAIYNGASTTVSVNDVQYNHAYKFNTIANVLPISPSYTAISLWPTNAAPVVTNNEGIIWNSNNGTLYWVTTNHLNGTLLATP